MDELRHRFIEVNGIRMHVAEQGHGPLVVLCHGWPESWYVWRHQITALAEAGYHVVAPDQRGYGQTDAPEALEAYHLFKLTGDIVGLVHALGEARATVIGHDWGSLVAWYCALLRPDMFDRVVLMSVPYLQRNWDDPKPSAAIGSLETADEEFYQAYFQQRGRAEEDLESDVRESLTALLNGGFGTPEPGLPMVNKRGGLAEGVGGRPGKPDWLADEELDYLVGEYERTGFRGGLDWYRQLDELWELNGFMSGAKIRQPSLFIAGEYDAVVRDMHPGVFAQLEDNMPGLRRKVLIEKSGHWIQQQRPAEVNRLILDFLKD